MRFQHDFNYMIDAVMNRRPTRLPIYEHLINPGFMEKVYNLRFADLIKGDVNDLDEYFRIQCRFFQEMTYDTVSFEVCITEILPDNGAIMGGKPGPIQSWQDFEHYPWDELPTLFWQVAAPRFDALARAMPAGMKALGGVGNGVFEISEDLVGFQYLAYLQADQPELYTALYQKIGDLMMGIWKTFLNRYADLFAICRFGDDLGFKSGTLVSPKTLRQYVFPQYQRIIQQIKAIGKPFLYHSCGKIFAVMEDMIAMGIDAKHSNEDIIAPFDTWIGRYGSHIGLLGGIDVDVLCQKPRSEIIDLVYEKGSHYRSIQRGYALGSGNSIPDYIPVEGYMAMIEAAWKIRSDEPTKSF